MISAAAHDLPSFRSQARELLQRGIAPEAVLWTSAGQTSLLDRAGAEAVSGASQAIADPRVPPEFMERAELAADHGDPERFAVLYRLLWKITHGARDALGDPLDPDAARLAAMLREVREEYHRMQAFVRFRRGRAPDGSEHWLAWFRPAHHVLPRVARYFARRYPALPWTLFTPEASATWDGSELRFGPGAPRATAPANDEIDALFASYYEQIFNPARTNLKVMRRHLPQRILEQLPEGAQTKALATQAGDRVRAMTEEKPSAASELLPEERSLPRLAEAASTCRACPIGEHATQTVFGTGPPRARLMIVGEQPGDEEDLAGQPFVGPAGRLLDELLSRAGILRSEVYVTNAVKHFKFERRGKRRLHERPNTREVKACRAWLMAEVEAVKPELILCLGATAAQSFCGAEFRITRDRGKPMTTPWADWFMATYHPSALLRAPDAASRARMEGEFLADLELTRARLDRHD